MHAPYQSITAKDRVRIVQLATRTYAQKTGWIEAYRYLRRGSISNRRMIASRIKRIRSNYGKGGIGWIHLVIGRDYVDLYSEWEYVPELGHSKPVWYSEDLRTAR